MSLSRWEIVALCAIGVGLALMYFEVIPGHFPTAVGAMLVVALVFSGVRRHELNAEDRLFGVTDRLCSALNLPSGSAAGQIVQRASEYGAAGRSAVRLSNEVKNLKAELAAAQEAAAAVRKEQRELEALRAEAATFAERLENLRGQLARAKEQSEAANRELADLRQSEKREVKAAQKELKELQQRLDETLTRITQLEAEIASLKRSLNDAQLQGSKDAETASRLKQEMLRVEALLQELRDLVEKCPWLKLSSEARAMITRGELAGAGKLLSDADAAEAVMAMVVLGKECVSAMCAYLAELDREKSRAIQAQAARNLLAQAFGFGVRQALEILTNLPDDEREAFISALGTAEERFVLGLALTEPLKYPWILNDGALLMAALGLLPPETAGALACLVRSDLTNVAVVLGGYQKGGQEGDQAQPSIVCHFIPPQLLHLVVRAGATGGIDASVANIAEILRRMDVSLDGEEQGILDPTLCRLRAIASVAVGRGGMDPAVVAAAQGVFRLFVEKRGGLRSPKVVAAATAVPSATDRHLREALALNFPPPDA